MSRVEFAELTVPSRLSFRTETIKSQSLTHVNKKGSKIALVQMTKQNILQIAWDLLLTLSVQN